MIFFQKIKNSLWNSKGKKLFPLEMGQPRDDDIETVDRRERRKAAKIGEESRRVRDHLYNELEG